MILQDLLQHLRTEWLQTDDMIGTVEQWLVLVHEYLLHHSVSRTADYEVDMRLLPIRIP